MITTKKILLLLAEITDDIISLHRDYYRCPHKALFDSFPREDRNTVYGAVRRLLSAGQIEKVVIGEEVYYQITSQGWEKLKLRLSLTKWQQRPWDGFWRVVIFDIAERRREKRDLLRRHLDKIGFGHLQRSVWISPFDVVEQIQEILSFQGLSEEAIIFQARQIGEGSSQDLAKRAWPLLKISGRYESILDELDKAKRKHPNNPFELNKAREQYIESYSKILEKDPCLPRELLPSYWKGRQGRKTFQQTAAELKQKLKTDRKLPTTAKVIQNASRS